jgi:hypothetical protein
LLLVPMYPLLCMVVVEQQERLNHEKNFLVVDLEMLGEASSVE